MALKLDQQNVQSPIPALAGSLEHYVAIFKPGPVDAGTTNGGTVSHASSAFHPKVSEVYILHVRFLPIVGRELRVAARHRQTYRSRMRFVILSSLLAAVLLLTSDGASLAAGNTLFPMLVNLALLFCLVAGVRHAADCLSEEKREGTLGLLFLTDLRGHDVVLGKLVAVSTRLFQGLIAFVPVLSVGLLLGGLSLGEFWRVTAILVNILFFTLCVALWISTMSVRADRALAMTSLALLVLLGLPILGDWLLVRLVHTPSGVLEWASPVAAAAQTPDLAYQAAPRRFWTALILNHLFGWSFLLCASFVLPRSWNAPAQRVLLKPVIRGSADRPGPGAKSAPLRRAMLDQNPILWLAARNERGRWLLWALVAGAILVSAAGLLLTWGLGSYALGISAVLQLGVALVLKVWVAWRSCATLAEARRTGAVELLLATPIKIEEIIRGHWQALQRFFLWPVVVATLLYLVPLAAPFLAPNPAGNTMLAWPSPVLALLGMATLVLDLVALAWVGMWMGLSQTRRVQAFAKTLLYAMIIPTVVFCLPNMVFALFWISWARRKLEHEFRSAAQERWAPAPAVVPSTAVPAGVPPLISAKIPREAIDL